MSTQLLTELPRIQKTGMDYNTVLQEMKNIINDNPKWKDNWNEFYESEAGTMFMSLFAWLTDNINTRQDMLINEMFIGTAQDDTNKIKHLKSIGYIPKMAHSSKVPIRIVLNKVLQDDVYLTKPSNGNLRSRVNEIFSFKDKDVNGRIINWEILKIEDEKPDYLGGVCLEKNNIEFVNCKNNKDSNNFQKIFALQGKTVYEEFTVTTSEGPSFTLKEKNISSDSIQVFLSKKEGNEKLLEVKSFLFSAGTNKISYVVEVNSDRSFKIRFADKDTNSKLLSAGSKISVFYRVCDGELGNIKSNYISSSTEVIDESGNAYFANLYNDFPAVGGSNKEDLDKAIRNGPLNITTMDRAVTSSDYDIILNNNTNIYKSRSYTSSNQPKNFKDYYGRYINPQETFIFSMINKNHENISTEKYNNFPWMSSLRDPMINEKYIFDKGSFNEETTISGISYNVKINETDEYNNAITIKMNNEFISEMYDSNYNKNDFLKLKLSTKKNDCLFFEDIDFDLLGSSKVLKDKMITMKGNLLEEEDNARFISNDIFKLDKALDIKKYYNLNFNLNGISININLLPDGAKNNNYYYLLLNNEVSNNIMEGDDLDQTENAAKKRPGIIQKINSAFNIALGKDGDFKYFNNKSIKFTGITNDVLRKNLDSNGEMIINNFSIFLKTGEHEDTYEYSKEGTKIKTLEDIVNILNEVFNKDNKYKAYTKQNSENTFINEDGISITTIDVKEIVITNTDNFEIDNERIDLKKKDANDFFEKYFNIDIDKSTVANKSVNYDNVKIAEIIFTDEAKEYGRFFIKTPNKGKEAKLFFRGGNNNFFKKYMNIYFDDNGVSPTTIGMKKIKLLTEDTTSVSLFGKPRDDIKYTKGTLIFENSCMFNSYDFNNIYSNYKLKLNDKLEINKNDNFYYSGNNDNFMKSDVYGILGQKVVYEDDYSDYLIDKNESDFNIKLTRNKVNTNSLFSIKDEDCIDVIECDSVKLETCDINKKDIEKANYKNILLNIMDNDDQHFIKIDLNNIMDSHDLLREIRSAILKNLDEFDNINKKFNYFFSLNFDNNNNIILKSFNKDPSGVISFKLPEENTDEYRKIYRYILGTNKTNSNLYKTYPIDLFEEQNIVLVNENENENEKEYYYAPSKDRPLSFNFRQLSTSKDGENESRTYDYYITFEKVSEDKGRYRFYLNKNKFGKFPDSYFYLHFINDKTFYKKISNKNMDTDEESLQLYMDKHKISGTDIVFLQPYFRTYDIKLKVIYNSMFSKDEITNKITKNINSICDLEHSEIGGRISKSKILKAAMNCDGVIDCIFSFLGFDEYGETEDDRKDREEIVSDFFEVCLLHEYSKNGKGLQLELTSKSI